MQMVPFDWQGTRVRTVMRDGAPWFVAADVCAVMGHTNPTVAVSRLDDDERQTVNLNTLNFPYGIPADPRRGNPNVSIISESGLFALILTSNLPSARAFRRWVTGEVLPALRAFGYYALPGAGAADRPLGPEAAGLARRLLAAVEAEAA
ncbi:MAG: Bro-N domain-containing protein, partial [Gemmobacter sp.]